MQFHAVGFAGDAFPQTIYLSATVLACDINEANSCEAQGCTACGTGYAPTGRKRRSAEHGEVSYGKMSDFFKHSIFCRGTKMSENLPKSKNVRK